MKKKIPNQLYLSWFENSFLVFAWLTMILSNLSDCLISIRHHLNISNISIISKYLIFISECEKNLEIKDKNKIQQNK